MKVNYKICDQCEIKIEHSSWTIIYHSSFIDKNWELHFCSLEHMNEYLKNKSKENKDKAED